MPITRKQFELGIDSTVEDWMEKIYTFLDQNKTQAFNSSEIGAALDAPSNYGEMGYAQERAFNSALEKLVEMNAVNEREVEGTIYFAPGKYTLKQLLTDAPLEPGF